MSFQLPDTPLIVAGGLGGPFCLFATTPARNALTLGAGNASAGIGFLYKEVFAHGFGRGWAGGAYPAAAACPAFIFVGPAYHMFSSVVGVPGACFLSAIGETAIMYGGETANAQLSVNQQKPGLIKNVQPAWKPWGPGVGIHIARNALAMAGLRIFCTPCEYVIEKASGKKNEATKVAGSFGGNVLSACLTAPVSQLYSFVCTTPELQTLGSAEVRQRMKDFLRESYMENGKFKPTFARDMTMRSMYVATLYTMYSSIERTAVAYWPK